MTSSEQSTTFAVGDTVKPTWVAKVRAVDCDDVLISIVGHTSFRCEWWNRRYLERCSENDADSMPCTKEAGSESDPKVCQHAHLSNKSPIPTPEYVLTAEMLVAKANLKFVNEPAHTSALRELVTGALRNAYNDGHADACNEEGDFVLLRLTYERIVPDSTGSDGR